MLRGGSFIGDVGLDGGMMAVAWMKAQACEASIYGRFD